ncbi:MAG: hypothetical protein IKA31_02880 [Clostridia bacterium]|nr:hypothetical protein [Clostridia bacterium]
MSKRRKNISSMIVAIVALILLLALMLGLLLNFERLFPSDDSPVEDSGNGNTGDIPDDSNDGSELAPKVFFNDVEITPGNIIVSSNSTTSLRIESQSSYTASFIAVTDFKSWDYKIDGEWQKFKPDVTVLESSITDNTAMIVMPYDIMEWVLLMNAGVSEEQIELPTDVDHKQAYIALKIDREGESYIYPISFDLNGVWTKCVLDKDEIVFCA